MTEICFDLNTCLTRFLDLLLKFNPTFSFIFLLFSPEYTACTHMSLNTNEDDLMNILPERIFHKFVTPKSGDL